jgi:hypothetical protein
MDEAPENVRLVIAGVEYPCDVLRDPDEDTDGCAAWVAVPRDPIPPGAVPEALRAAVLPAKTALIVRLDPEASA